MSNLQLPDKLKIKQAGCCGKSDIRQTSKFFMKPKRDCSSDIDCPRKAIHDLFKWKDNKKLPCTLKLPVIVCCAPVGRPQLYYDSCISREAIG